MARTTPRPPPTHTQTLQAIVRHCPCCGEPMWAAYHNYRTITTLEGIVRLTLQIRRCLNLTCPHVRKPYRPEAEGRLALPKHEFGLDVLTFIGTQRYTYHSSVPTIHQALVARGLAVAPRTVTNLLERYDELVALSLQDTARLRRLTQPQGRVILALDGLQPDVGQEVLWVLRDCLSGEVLLARSLLSATHADLAALIREVKQALEVPIEGVITDGQWSIRAAVAQALPEVPHQLCHFHYLREAAKPIYEADRHAKKVLKKHVRGVRPLERAVEGRTDPEAEVIRGYCSAVRSALTDDGRPPLAAAGLQLHDRLNAIAQSLERVEKRGPCPRPSGACRRSCGVGGTRRRRCGLFHCYNVPDLPRTNNDLEQFFGAYRYHERRATGRKAASPAVVLRGAVRLVACAATRIRPFTSAELAPDTVSAWQELRHALETRRHQRTQRRRFRRDPATYLGKLETKLLQLSLPP